MAGGGVVGVGWWAAAGPACPCPLGLSRVPWGCRLPSPPGRWASAFLCCPVCSPLGLSASPGPLGGGCLAILAPLCRPSCSGLRCSSHMLAGSGLLCSCRVPLLSSNGNPQNVLRHYSYFIISACPLCTPFSLMSSLTFVPWQILYTIRTPLYWCSISLFDYQFDSL